jgi:hypothetical protein
MGDEFAERHAVRGTAGLPLVWRIFIYGMSRIGTDGRTAIFADSELSETFGKSPQMISNAIRRGKAEGLFEEESDAHAIVFPYHQIGRGKPSVKAARRGRKAARVHMESEVVTHGVCNAEHETPSSDLTPRPSLFVVGSEVDSAAS